MPNLPGQMPYLAGHLSPPLLEKSGYTAAARDPVSDGSKVSHTSNIKGYISHKKFMAADLTTITIRSLLALKDKVVRFT